MDLITEGTQLLNTLKLIDILPKYGQTRIVGSMALNLVTRKDIDIEVTGEVITKDDLAQISSDLIKNTPYRIKVTMIDNLDKHNLTNPQGLYLGIEYYGEKPNKDTPWNIDTWFVQKEQAYGDKNTQITKGKMNEELRQLILDLKTELLDDPDYRKKFYSFDVYNAVLDNNVTNMGELREYLRSIGKLD